MKILEIVPSNLFENIFDSNFILPIENVVISNVRIEAIAMDYFHLSQTQSDNAYENNGKLFVWKRFLKELKEYINNSLSDDTSEETIEQIFQCIYWPLTCSINEIEVNRILTFFLPFKHFIYYYFVYIFFFCFLIKFSGRISFHCCIGLEMNF